MPPSPRTGFELALFAADLDVVRAAVAGGVQTVVVDWEHEGKEARQAAADTEINRHTVEHLEAARAATGAWLLCRLNRLGGQTAREVELALAAGADELLLPMVRTPAEVEQALTLVDGRAGLGILVETKAAVESAAELARLPLSRVYVGLNDLAIERGTRTIFAPLHDGLLDELRERFAALRFGFGGLTLPEAGEPVPCRLLLGDLARLRADFTFLRRSFYRDVAGRDPELEAARIRAAVAEAFARPASAEAADRAELLSLLEPAETQAAVA